MHIPNSTSVRAHLTQDQDEPRPRTAPYEHAPGFYIPGRLWLYGNTRLLLTDLVCIPACFAHPGSFGPKELDAIEREAEHLVLSGKTLVCGVHNAAHQRAAILPLRWGAPRVLVVSGGIRYHLGKELKQEPFRAARLWRYQWDPQTDLILSRRAPNRLPTYALHNPTVDRLIGSLTERTAVGFSGPTDPFGPHQSRQ